MERALPGHPDDAHRVDISLAFVPQAAAQARSMVRAEGSDVRPDLAADAELLTSEVVSNAVMHGAPPLSLSVLAADGQLIVEVSDGSDDLPRFPAGDADPDAVGGRGLRIVQMLASAWGIHTTTRGKTVWFRLAG
ncbi:ATP-binding protein [Nocardioides terrae]|uniref:ATP-binding protein n=1 Tax=Nocardioides terrae TaxID=574651 RepID=UPI000B85B7F0|nr:ATP-binding protein [Nocardioides terrae]